MLTVCRAFTLTARRGFTLTGRRGFTLTARHGFSLIELTVVLAIVGVVGSAIGTLLMRQQRFYRAASELITTRQSVRDAIEVLTADIRGMSVADTARLLSDSAMEFFSTIGASVVCQSPSPSQVDLPPVSASRAALTSFATQPDTGDLAVFYVDSGPVPARWQRYRITGVSARATATACPPSTGFTRDADVGFGPKAFTISLERPLNDGIQAGSPVRFVRRGRYSLYRSADGEWYLGYRRCNAIGPSVCGAIQPLSGPYRPYDGDASQSGLSFHYFDRSGSRMNGSPLSLARVDINARAASRQTLSFAGRGWTPSDSAHVSVAVRNSLR